MQGKETVNVSSDSFFLRVIKNLHYVYFYFYSIHIIM